MSLIAYVCLALQILQKNMKLNQYQILIPIWWGCVGRTFFRVGSDNFNFFYQSRTILVMYYFGQVPERIRVCLVLDRLRVL